MPYWSPVVRCGSLAMRRTTIWVNGGCVPPMLPPGGPTSVRRWNRKPPGTDSVARSAEHPERLRALLRLIRDELGYALYRAVSEVKTELSRARTAVLRFTHADFAIEETITRDDFELWIAADIARIAATVQV